MKTKEEQRKDHAAYMRRYYEKMRSEDPEKYRALLKEKYRRRKASGWKDDPEKIQARNARRDPARMREQGRMQRLALTKETFDAYGGHCVCCGETNYTFLTIDHVNGNGTQHRKELFGDRKAGIHMYRWLRTQGFPQDDYRLMCFNCNLGRQRNGGACPHSEAA
jgi:hypothetical protein